MKTKIKSKVIRKVLYDNVPVDMFYIKLFKEEKECSNTMRGFISCLIKDSENMDMDFYIVLN